MPATALTYEMQKNFELTVTLVNQLSGGIVALSVYEQLLASSPEGKFSSCIWSDLCYKNSHFPPAALIAQKASSRESSSGIAVLLKWRFQLLWDREDCVYLNSCSYLEEPANI